MILYKDQFIPWLKIATGRAYTNSQKNEIICYCPFCEGDRGPNHHGHLYISTDEPVYYCQKCGEKGTTPKLIKYLHGNPEEHIDPEAFNAIYGDYNYINKNLSSEVNTFSNVKSIQKDVNNFNLKLEYLNKRFKKPIIPENIPGLVLSFSSFLSENGLSYSWLTPDKIKTLDDGYIGFVTNRGTKIILRNCLDDNNPRYMNINITSDKFFYSDFYGIKVSTLNNEIPNIVLCEGIFDLYGAIYSDKFNDLLSKTLFWGATLGKGSYYKVFLSVLDWCKCTKVNLHILSDRDVKEYHYHKIKKSPFINRVCIYYNKLGKDFGETNVDVFKTIIKPRS